MGSSSSCLHSACFVRSGDGGGDTSDCSVTELDSMVGESAIAVFISSTAAADDEWFKQFPIVLKLIRVVFSLRGYQLMGLITEWEIMEEVVEFFMT